MADRVAARNGGGKAVEQVEDGGRKGGGELKRGGSGRMEESEGTRRMKGEAADAIRAEVGGSVGKVSGGVEERAAVEGQRSGRKEGKAGAVSEGVGGRTRTVAEEVEERREAERRARQAGDETNRGGKTGAEVEYGYTKEAAVNVEMEGEDQVTMMELLRAIEEVCGRVVACRMKQGRRWEISMGNPRGKERLLDGFKIKNNRVIAMDVVQNIKIVSFLNLPAYITDEQITEKLVQWGVERVSDIKRRKWAGTEMTDGTRFMKVKFNENVKSLPYSVKFETVEGTEYFRLLHDQQMRVCRMCLQAGHIVKDCPELKCFKCGEGGHFARECQRRDVEGGGRGSMVGQGKERGSEGEIEVGMEREEGESEEEEEEGEGEMDDGVVEGGESEEGEEEGEMNVGVVEGGEGGEGEMKVGVVEGMEVGGIEEGEVGGGCTGVVGGGRAEAGGRETVRAGKRGGGGARRAVEKGGQARDRSWSRGERGGGGEGGRGGSDSEEDLRWVGIGKGVVGGRRVGRVRLRGGKGLES